MTLSSYWDKLADYFVTWINDSPNAVDSSAIERRVKFGNPVVHLETTASLLPIFLAKSRWLIFFSLRIESMRAIMSADNWISVRISGDTDESFALNQSCLFLISQKQHHRCHWVLSPQFPRMTICSDMRRQYKRNFPPSIGIAATLSLIFPSGLKKRSKAPRFRIACNAAIIRW